MLGWVRQDDTHSCGPLSTAAAFLIVEGIPPMAKNLRHFEASSSTVGNGDGLSAIELQELRQRLQLVWMNAVNP